jgi:hypothetical protein
MWRLCAGFLVSVWWLRVGSGVAFWSLFDGCALTVSWLTGVYVFM